MSVKEAACGTSPSIFNPASDNAAAIAKFSWLLFAVAGIVFTAMGRVEQPHSYRCSRIT